MSGLTHGVCFKLSPSISACFINAECGSLPLQLMGSMHQSWLIWPADEVPLAPSPKPEWHHGTGNVAERFVGPGCALWPLLPATR